MPVLHGMKTDDPSYMLRIDGKTGKTEWRVERPTKAIRESPDAYITPALARVGSGHEIIINGGDVVTGHDPGDAAKSCGAPMASTPTTIPRIASSHRP